VLVTGVSARAMADSAARAGYAVTSLDAFGDLDRSPRVTALSLSRDFGTPFSAAAAAHAARAVASDAVAYLSPFENHASAVAVLADGRALWGNAPSVLRRARDPRLLARLFAPDTPAVTSTNQQWLLKPRASGGGHGIRWWHPGDVVPKGSYVQPFVEGVPGSVAFVAAHGRATPIGLTRQLVGEAAFGATGFRYCGSILGAADDPQFDRDAELLEAACHLADVAARELGLVGVNGIDFIARDGGAVAIEINPRWSASMELVERSYGLSVFDAHARACASGALPAFDLARARTARAAVGKAIVFARHEVVCGDTTEWLTDATVRDIPHPGEHIPAGRPVCTVYAEADDALACEAALVERAAAVHAILEHWSPARV